MLSLPNFGVTVILAYTSKIGNEEKTSVSPTEKTRTATCALILSGQPVQVTVAPQVLLDPRAMATSIFLLEVRLQNKPVFIVHLKPLSQLGLLIRRQEANEQLRSRMGDLCGQYPPLGHYD